MTTTSSNSSSPSNSVNNCDTTRSLTPASLPPPSRSPASASISSKKTTAGAFSRAVPNTSRTPCSLSPTYLSNSSGPFTEMKFDSASFATAFANNVLPVPGGPYNNTPRAGANDTRANASGYANGHCTVSFTRPVASPNPPTSAHVTSGTSTNTSRNADGPTPRRAASKSLARTATPSSPAESSSDPSSPASPASRPSACIALSVTRVSRSAPTNPWVFAASPSKSTSSARGTSRV